jgi:hypothetical protein
LLIAIALVTSFLRPWYRKWGATVAEVNRFLLGDELVAYLREDYTHAITIWASAAVASKVKWLDEQAAELVGRAYPTWLVWWVVLFCAHHTILKAKQR